MSVFAPGTDGTLKSTNIPAAFVELAHLKNQQEVAASTADVPIENTTVDYSEETRQVTIAATVNFTSSTDGSGNIVLTASNDLPSASFAPGTDGTLNKTSYAGALMELAQTMANAEAAVTPAVNNVNITYSDEDKASTINATIPYTSIIDSSGKPVITVTDYLG